MKPDSIPELIDRWPSIAAFADEFGVGYEAARQMRRRGRIAPEHWQSLVNLCNRKGIAGVTYDWLASLRSNEGEAA